MRTIKIKNFTFICFTKNTRSGFKHEARMLINETFISEATQYWVNRTQESFIYQSVMRKCVQNYIAQIEYGIETNYRNENNVIRKTKKHFEKLNELFDNPFFDSELQYSLQDVTDEILDLKLHERLHFKSDRGIENSLGIIIRIQ